MSGRLKIIDLLEAERRAVLFVDKSNTTCSMMADGFASYFSPNSMQIFSAGLTPGATDSLTLSVMKEIGIEVPTPKPKPLSSIDLNQIAVLVSMCDIELFPKMPDHIKHLPIPLADPAELQGSEIERLEAYRLTRDQVREVVSTLL